MLKGRSMYSLRNTLPFEMRKYALRIILLAFSFLQTFAITVLWDANPETDVAGYNVYYGPVGTTPLKTNIPGRLTTSLTIDNSQLVSGTTYIIYVTAYNTAGLESFPS